MLPSVAFGLSTEILNTHHSFFPAFSGVHPYHAAFRGAKLIGTTSHYVTDVPGDGPIIELNVAHVSHRDQVEDLIQKGRDLERVVLARAVRLASGTPDFLLRQQNSGF